LRDRARHGPGFLDPVLGHMAGEDVVELAAADGIADHVAVRPDPADILVASDRDRAGGPDTGRAVLDRPPAAPPHPPRVAGPPRGRSSTTRCWSARRRADQAPAPGRARAAP